MADGCSPLTGEVLPADHVLLDERVMEALLIAIEALQGKPLPVDVQLDADDLLEAVELYRALAITPTAHRLSALLAGERSIKDTELLQHALYGKHRGRYTKAQLLPSVEQWVKQHNINPPKQRPEGERVIHPYFQAAPYNKLSERAIAQLKEKIHELPLQRTEGLSASLIERRLTWPRSHEPWPEEEMRLLKKALEFTNDLAFLSTAFGRTDFAISAQAEKLLPTIEPDLGE
jgi:hypothetical protein